MRGAVTSRRGRPDRRTVAVTLAWLVAGLLVGPAGLLAGPAAHAAPVPSPSPDPQPVTVSIPELAYGAVDDSFRVGPFPSLLDVLADDEGPRDPATLQLLDDQGQPVQELRLPGVGVLQVSGGYLRLDPARNLGGTATVRYRAASPQGGSDDGTAAIVATRAVSVLDDRASTGAGRAVTVPVASNDTLLVTGAYRVCGPRLSATRPARPDVVVVVRPEPARPDPRPCPPASTLTTPDGTWAVAEDGTVRFSPAAGARGSARVWYSQDADYPYDVGTGRILVVVSPGPRPTPEPGGTPGPTPSPGTTPARGAPGGDGAGAGGAGGAGAPGGQGGGAGGAAGGSAGGSAAGAGGPLALTGSSPLVLALAGSGLLALGAALLAARRRGRPDAVTVSPRR